MLRGQGICISVPHHITGFFKPIYTGKEETTGSIGAGIAVNPPFRACYGSGLAGYERGSNIPVATARRALDLINAEDLIGDIWYLSPLPPGRGYAVSASSSIAFSLLAGLVKGRYIRESLRTAHIAEVLESTGLGDVLAISCGIGLVVRTSPGAPGIGDSDCIPLPDSIAIIAIEAGSMATRTLIKLSTKASELVDDALKKLIKKPDLGLFLEYSHRFSKELGLYDYIKKSIDVNGIVKKEGVIGHFVKKQTLILFIESSFVKDIVGNLIKSGINVRLIKPSNSPPQVGYT